MFTNVNSNIGNTHNTTFTYKDKNYRWEVIENDKIHSTYLHTKEETWFIPGAFYFDTTNNMTMEASLEFMTDTGISNKK